MAQAALAVRTKFFNPDLGQNTRRRAIGWSIGARSAGLGLAQAQLVDLEARPDGTGRLFSGRVGERSSGQSGTRLLLFEDALVGLARRAFAALGALYAVAAYSGPVDVGVAVLGLEGSEVLSGSNANASRGLVQVPFPIGEDYRDTDRVGAEDLRARADDVARRLLMPLIQATAQGYDPFQ